MDNKKIINLTFRGKKQELHEQLKRWCEEAGETMNGTVLELIEKHLKNKKNV